MADFPRHDKQSAPEAARPLLEAGEQAFGFIPNLFAQMAEAPALLEAYQAIGGIFARSSLAPLEQIVVLLTVSRFHECRYCVAAHSVGADMAKVPAGITDALREDRPLADARLQALREFTVHLLDRRGWAEDARVEATLAAGFSRQQLLDVLVGIAQKTLSNYTNHLAGTELDAPMAHRAWQPPAD